MNEVGLEHGEKKRNETSCLQNILHGFLSSKLEVIEHERQRCSTDRERGTASRSKAVQEGIQIGRDSRHRHHHRHHHQSSSVLNDSRNSQDYEFRNHSEHSFSRGSELSGLNDYRERPRHRKRLREVPQSGDYGSESFANTDVRSQRRGGAETASNFDSNKFLCGDPSEKSAFIYNARESRSQIADGDSSRTKHGKKKSKKGESSRRSGHKQKKRHHLESVDASVCEDPSDWNKREEVFHGERGDFFDGHMTCAQDIERTDGELERVQDDNYENSWIGRYNRTEMFRKRRSESSSERKSKRMLRDRLSCDEVNPGSADYLHNSSVLERDSEASRTDSRKDCKYRTKIGESDASFPRKTKKRRKHDQDTKHKIESYDGRRSTRKKRLKMTEEQYNNEDLSMKLSTLSDKPLKQSHKKHSRSHKKRDSHKHRSKQHTKKKTAEVADSRPTETVKESEEIIDEGNFIPMKVRAEETDDVTELLLQKRASSGQLDYTAIVACAKSSSLPSRIVETYKDGVAVSRLLKRVKTRLGPLKPTGIQRVQATLPCHPALTFAGKRARSLEDKPVDSNLVLNSTVEQDVEDPGAKRIMMTNDSSTNYISNEEKCSTSGELPSTDNLSHNEVMMTEKSDIEDGADLVCTAALVNVSSITDSLPVENDETKDDSISQNLDDFPDIQGANSTNVETEGTTFEIANQVYSKILPLQLSSNVLDALRCSVEDVDPNPEVTQTVSVQNLEEGVTQSEGDLVRSLVSDIVVEKDVSRFPIVTDESDSVVEPVAVPRLTNLLDCEVQSFPQEVDTFSKIELEADGDDRMSRSDGEISEDETVEINDANGDKIQTSLNLTDAQYPNAADSSDKMDILEAGTLDNTHLNSKIESISNNREKYEKSYLNNYVREGCFNDQDRKFSDEIGQMIEQLRNDGPSYRSDSQLEMMARDPHGNQSDCEVEDVVPVSAETSFDIGAETSRPLSRNDLDPRFEVAGQSYLCEDSSNSKFWSMKKAAKKLARHIGIKISDWSSAFISSGERFENDPKKRNREEGELTDSSVESSDSEELEPVTEKAVNEELLSSGSLDDSAEEVETRIRKEKSKKKQKKHRRKQKKHKTRRSKGSTSDDEDERARSRARSRAFSVTRTFDQKKGVWRERERRLRLSEIWGRKRRKLDIDKEKLREIAIKNSLHNVRQMAKVSRGKSKTKDGPRPGGRSVTELTDFCKTISGANYDPSESDDEIEAKNKDRSIENDESDVFINNFLRSRDKDARIVLNIRDSKQLPALTAQQMIAKKAVMKLMYPISNGAEHRNRSDWVPVKKPDPPRPYVEPVPTITIPAVPPTPAATAAVELASARAPVCVPEHAVTAEENRMSLPPNIDISMILAERLAAIKRLCENPTDQNALQDVKLAQMQMQLWAEKKQIPGQFFSSVSQSFGNKLKKNDWLRKAKENETSPVCPLPVLQSYDIVPATDNASGQTYNIGKLMMLRMGWREGEGLGRQNLGRPTPISLDQKTDRRGLQAAEERTKAPPRVFSVGKHPVSSLMELCTKRHLNFPNFVLVEDSGPAHYKKFRYKVVVNGVEYQPIVGSRNKKTARLEAARCCLDALTSV